jgi:uncharacterized transporter YbjL
MQSMLTLLAENQLLLLFVIIGLGYLVGNIRIAGFQLGVVSVLFAGIFLGALDRRLGLPEYIYVIGYKFFKLPMAAVMGMMSGMQTQPACLAYANQQVPNELPNVWYATVYPPSMVAKILLAQVIVSILLR